MSNRKWTTRAFKPAKVMDETNKNKTKKQAQTWKNNRGKQKYATHFVKVKVETVQELQTWSLERYAQC